MGILEGECERVCVSVLVVVLVKIEKSLLFLLFLLFFKPEQSVVGFFVCRHMFNKSSSSL